MKNYIELSLTEVLEALNKGEVTSVELTKQCLEQIEKTKELNLLHEVCSEIALKKAQEVDEKRAKGEKLGRLAGVPIVLKDNISMIDTYTTCSSKFLEDYKSPYNATVAQKLIDADAVIIGKANMDEFAMGSSSENCAFGVVRNPRNPECVPGGSSGGSAGTVGAFQCFGALGTDTGGSIRQPASYCGVVGMKPTYGAVSRYGVVAYASSLDQVGPLTRTVRDNALLLSVIAGNDKQHEVTSSVNEFETDYENSFTDSVKGLKIGIAKEFFELNMNEDVEKAIKDAIDFYVANGAELVDISIPNIKDSLAVYYVLASAEATSNLARFDGIKYGRAGTDYKDVTDFYFKSRSQGFGKEVKRRIMLGNFVLSSGYFDAYYNKAKAVQNLIIEQFNKAFEKCDIILCPTAPTTAFKIGQKVTNPVEMYLNDIFTVPVNIATLPGLSIPCGESNGMPIGLQLIGARFSEKTIYNAGDFFERNFNKEGK